MACQRFQGDAQLCGLRVDIVDVDVVLALSLVCGIGQEPKPRIRREPAGPKPTSCSPVGRWP